MCSWTLKTILVKQFFQCIFQNFSRDSRSGDYMRVGDHMLLKKWYFSLFSGLTRVRKSNISEGDISKFPTWDRRSPQHISGQNKKGKSDGSPGVLMGFYPTLIDQSWKYNERQHTSVSVQVKTEDHWLLSFGQRWSSLSIGNKRVGMLCFNILKPYRHIISHPVNAVISRNQGDNGRRVMVSSSSLINGIQWFPLGAN